MQWMKSSFCEASQCIEVKRLPSGSRVIRSTTTGESVIVLSAEWDAFVAGIRAGEFDEEDR